MLISICDNQAVLGRKYSESQIQSIPEITRQNAKQVAERQYKVRSKQGWVVFDNEHGLGAMPDNRTVLYRGFLAEMSPRKFRELAKDYAAGARNKDAASIKRLIEDGYGIGCPTLYINVDEYMNDRGTETPAYISGHEGRARSLALEDLGVATFFVQFQFIGWRARHVEHPRDLIDYLQSGVRKQESSKIVGSPIQGSAVFA